METQNQNRARTLWMAQTAILTAIIILMAFTPLGYLRVGTVSITFLTIPVVVGAILIGPRTGALLGAVFGLTSFAQCFGMDAFGTMLMSINPVYTFILTMVPRILTGLIVGLIFKALTKNGSDKTWIYGIASLSGAVSNTVLFVGALILFFGNSDYLRSFGETTLAILGVLVTVNAAIEAAVAMVIGTAVTKAISVAVNRRRQKPAA